MRKSCLTLFLFLLAVLQAEPLHPHLLFGRDELPDIRARAQSGVGQKALELLRARCEKHLALETFATQEKRGQLSEKALDPLTELALVWQITSESRYAVALERLVSVARSVQMDLLKYGCHVPFLFDWGYEALSPDSRNYLKQQILTVLRDDPRCKRFPPFCIQGNWGYFMYRPWAIRWQAVLAGHPEYDEAALRQMAADLKTLLCHAITSQGVPTEHGAYLNYPFELNGSAMLILQRKGMLAVAETNLPKLTHWLWLETTSVNPPRYFPLSDCRVQPPSLYVLRLLHLLLPNDAELEAFMRRCGEESEQRPDPISGLLYARSVGEGVLPDSPAYLADAQTNLLLFRANWQVGAWQFATQAIPMRGHSHSDVGSLVVFAGQSFRIFDPGYAVVAGTSHNIAGFDGVTPSAHGGAGSMESLVDSHGGVASVDSFDAWNTRVLYANRMEFTPQVSWAYRDMVFLAPENDLPGCIYVADNLRALKEQPGYELYWQQELTQRAELGEGFAWFEDDSCHARTKLLFLQPLSVKQTLQEKKLARSDQYHRTLQVSGGDGRFLTAILTLDNRSEPVVKCFERPLHGFSHALQWASCTDFLAGPQPCPKSGAMPLPARLKVVRVPKDALAGFPRELPDNLQWYLSAGGEFQVGSSLLFMAREAENDCQMITYPRVAWLAWAMCDAEGLRVTLRPEPRSHAKPLKIAVRAFAPNAKTVVCNGVSIPFQQHDKYVDFTFSP